MLSVHLIHLSWNSSLQQSQVVCYFLVIFVLFFFGQSFKARAETMLALLCLASSTSQRPARWLFFEGSEMTLSIIIKHLFAACCQAAETWTGVSLRVLYTNTTFFTEQEEYKYLLSLGRGAV